MQKKKLLKYNRGFTLMETLITVAIFVIIMAGTTLMLKDIFLNNRTDMLSMNNVDQARRTANTFVNEIRNSIKGYNGSGTIGKADDNEIIFYSTAILNNGNVSKIRYYISNSVLYKEVTNPTGSPLGYNSGNTVTYTINKDLSLGGNPLFTYYDGNVAILTQPVNVTQVKFVKINLTVLKQIIPNSSDTFSISAGASFRNLKTNLGN